MCLYISESISKFLSSLVARDFQFNLRTCICFIIAGNPVIIRNGVRRRTVRSKLKRALRSTGITIMSSWFAAFCVQWTSAPNAV